MGVASPRWCRIMLGDWKGTTMARELQPIDIAHSPAVRRLAEEIGRSGVPRVLRSADRDGLVISPAPSKLARAGRGKSTSRKDALWDIVGIADAADFPDVPDDVSTNKHVYLANAYGANR
jgi:hypothetical protein